MEVSRARRSYTNILCLICYRIGNDFVDCNGKTLPGSGRTVPARLNEWRTSPKLDLAHLPALKTDIAAIVPICSSCIALLTEIDALDARLTECFAVLRELVTEHLKGEDSAACGPIPLTKPCSVVLKPLPVLRVKSLPKDGKSFVQNSSHSSEPSEEVEMDYTDSGRVVLVTARSPAARMSAETRAKPEPISTNGCEVKLECEEEMFEVKVEPLDDGDDFANAHQEVQPVKPTKRKKHPRKTKHTDTIPDDNGFEEPKVKKSDEMHACPTCGKAFTTNSHLRRHQEIHGSSRKPCHVCGRLVSEGHMRVHIASVHEGKKAFACKECGAEFKDHGQLIKHRAKEHGVPLPARFLPRQCPDCGIMVLEEGYLRRHLLRVHGISENGKCYTCEHCGDKFVTKFAITKHVLTRHENVRNHPCPDCNYRAAAFPTLRTHMRLKHQRYVKRVITGERDYSGDIPIGHQIIPYDIVDLDPSELIEERKKGELDTDSSDGEIPQDRFRGKVND